MKAYQKDVAVAAVAISDTDVAVAVAVAVADAAVAPEKKENAAEPDEKDSGDERCHGGHEHQ